MRILETISGYLGKLTTTNEARRYEGIHRGLVDIPVAVSRDTIDGRLSVIKEFGVITIPTIRFHWERIGSIDGALMVSMDLVRLDNVPLRCVKNTNQFNICQFVLICSLWIFLATNMRHITPVIGSIWCVSGIGTVIDKPIYTR